MFPYLAPEVQQSIVVGRGMDPARCARLLTDHLAAGQWPKELAPVIRRIEEAGARMAGRKVITMSGSINKNSRFAPYLLPDLAALKLSALIRLKIERRASAAAAWLRLKRP